MAEQLYVVWFLNERGWLKTFEGSYDEASIYLQELRMRAGMAYMSPRLPRITLDDICEGFEG